MSQKTVKLFLVAGALIIIGAIWFLPVGVDKPGPGAENPAETPVKTSVKTPVETPVGTFTLLVNFGDGKEISSVLDAVGDKDLFQLLQLTVEERGIEFDYKEYSGLGTLVTRIGELENGEDGKYWQYWVNGEYAKIGSSSYIPKVGDLIEWKFTNEEQ